MNTTRRIGLILLLIFLLPALFFSAYEITTLNRDEATIKEIYEKQLEAILFSANQYSDDILNSWISKIEKGIEIDSNEEAVKEVKNLMLLNESIINIFKYDTLSKKLEWFSKNIPDDSVELAGAYPIVENSKPIIKQLIEFEKSGFQKVEALRLNTVEDYVALMFKPKKRPEEAQIIGIVVNPAFFIEDILGPKLQQIAQDKFAISAGRVDVGRVVYATYDSSYQAQVQEIMIKDLWLLPNYYLGIGTKGTSIETIISERTTTNLYLILSLDLILILGVVLVFRNVKKEVQLAQNKSEFISNVSHEIRTPLALISMFAETLEMGRVPSEEKKNEYYSIISKETQRLTNIVNKILNFSQMDASKKELNFKPMSLTELVNEVLNTYEFHLQQQGFTLISHTDEEVAINGDKESIMEVVINLIDNAIKYSENDKQIEVAISQSQGFALLSVKDSGVGIPKNIQKQIFEKFYRAPTGDLAKKQGTGLGLALVKQIVDLHRGKIEVKSDEGKGSTFIIHLPVS
ncbi:sensor histidine kinase [Fulvivirga lutimaris]|uniref:sensor histidine kinase n=1 Tax=Fulvivirga lutimaris TaxID=1819566 RepID=UPI0012BBD2FF|nr:HAMP domain-containing sensor histidine kinase [Fulvivirga lutimaris]MTI40202.1 HAMP domain-containing histidine kinase [Fulvivirga lutimaris]